MGMYNNLGLLREVEVTTGLLRPGNGQQQYPIWAIKFTLPTCRLL